MINIKNEAYFYFKLVDGQCSSFPSHTETSSACAMMITYDNIITNNIDYASPAYHYGNLNNVCIYSDDSAKGNAGFQEKNEWSKSTKFSVPIGILLGALIGYCTGIGKFTTSGYKKAASEINL